jgi:hypothetical protein
MEREEMSEERFERLQKIAREEFGVTISRSDKKSSFKEVFGLDVETARQIGINACVEKLGRDFVEKYKETSTCAYGESEDGMFCFVGVDDVEKNGCDYALVLDSTSRFPYSASCVVSLENGAVTWREVVVPEK